MLAKHAFWLRSLVCLSLAAAWPGALTITSARAASPTAEQALKLAPIQRDVEIDRPTPEEAAKCTIKAEKRKGQTGWIVRDGDGKTLREFVDTNGDNVVDRWSYYKDGVEVYRDIDTKFNGKATEFRWLNTAGVRWGVSKSTTGDIDAWKMISAEEATAEAVMAFRDRDANRFSRLLLTSNELKSLGLTPAKTKEIADKVSAAPSAFLEIARRQNVITAKSSWVHFGGTRPGTVPAGSLGLSSDLTVYENVVAVIETDGKDSQIQIGTMIRVGDCWRLIDVPALPDASGKVAEATAGGVFFVSPTAKTGAPADAATTGQNEKLTKMLDELQKLDTAIVGASSDEARAGLNDQRADYFEQGLGELSDKDRVQWVRQMADTISAATQAGGYPKGIDRLKRLVKATDKSKIDPDMMAFVEFRLLTAEYAVALQQPNPEFAKVQAAWLQSLEKFVDRYPKAADASDAMLQLGIAQEFAGQDEKAKQWYRQIATNFDSIPAGKKAAGAVRRLESVGKPVELVGKSVGGEQVDLSNYKGKYVLIHYWATWCEPCKVDLAQLKEMQAKYSGSNFTLIGVSLDANRQTLDEYLSKNRLPWPQLFEPGGLDSRYANELGILTLPTMILIDDKGQVVNRSVHITELDGELRSRLK